jgi:hypothetical protein
MQSLEFERTSETVRGGFATPHRLTGLPGKLSGCVYRADGTKVRLSERLGGFMGDYAVSDNPDTSSRAGSSQFLTGRGLYLGHYMGGHYGHFITETLSTFWILEEHPADTFDYFLFHPFAFGLAMPAYVKFCLDRFGIPPEKVVFVGPTALEFEELVVPERLFRLNHSADRQSRWTYRHIAEGTPPPPVEAPRLYLSRRRFSRTNFERVVANEVAVEAEFEARGFQVLYPETLSFEQQVGYYSRAQWVAGVSGSGLHNSLFMQPTANLIELGDPRYDGAPAPTQALCNYISGVHSEFIPFEGARFGPRGTMLFDIGFLRARLDAILGPPLTDASQLKAKSAWSRALDGLEVAYLSTRPVAGSIARRLIGRPRRSPT